MLIKLGVNGMKLRQMAALLRGLLLLRPNRHRLGESQRQHQHQFPQHLPLPILLDLIPLHPLLPTIHLGMLLVQHLLLLLLQTFRLILVIRMQLLLLQPLWLQLLLLPPFKQILVGGMEQQWQLLNNHQLRRPQRSKRILVTIFLTLPWFQCHHLLLRDNTSSNRCNHLCLSHSSKISNNNNNNHFKRISIRE